MKTVLSLFFCIAILVVSSSGIAAEKTYDQAVSNWKSYEDVGKWLKRNFSFDKNRQKMIQKRLKTQGPSGLVVRAPEKLYDNSRGYCADAAYFVLHTLNRIDPGYNALNPDF